MTRAGRPRLALVAPGLAGGGGVQAVARFVRDVAVRSGAYDVQVVSLSESARDPLSVRLSSPQSWLRGPSVQAGDWEGGPVSHVGAMAGELEFQRYRPRRALRRVLVDSDLIQVVCGSPAWANAVVGLGPPVSLHVATRAAVERRSRDARPRGFGGWWRRAMTTVTDHLDDRALRGVDAIQVMNPWMLDYARRINAERAVDIRFLPPGVNAIQFHPVAASGPRTDRYVLCVGRLGDPRKRIGLLLDAYSRLPAALREHVRVVVAGSTPPLASFWHRAAQLKVENRVSFIANPGRIELLRLFQEASVFALPSDEEGFGMVLLEAMACGVPVVSTRSGGPDGIITDGEDGFLVSREDADGLASRLARVLEDSALASVMGRSARRTIEERYDERVIGQEFLNVWSRLIDTRRRAAH